MTYRILCADMARALGDNPDATHLVDRWRAIVSRVASGGITPYNDGSQ